MKLGFTLPDHRKSIVIWLHPQQWVIVVKYTGQAKWVEFRGKKDCDILLDTLEGWHTTVLYTEEPLLIHRYHPDYERVVLHLENEDYATPL